MYMSRPWGLRSGGSQGFRTAASTAPQHRQRLRLPDWKMMSGMWLQFFALVIFLPTLHTTSTTTSSLLSPEEIRSLRDESADMFYHGYNAYMANAYPADELMPLSCRGRFRGIEPDRGDIDESMGNFSLTLIDSLDTLIVLGDLDEFERAAGMVIRDVRFDSDIVVSVFEVNIRVVGGLISGHIFAEYLQNKFDRMKWYKGELLNMAVDVGYRLLPAFNSTTGLPYPRVNLKFGMKAGKVRQMGETCTACAGTMILEFAALSRLSGEPIFEAKASAAMDILWSSRHRMSNLVGNVLNVMTGDWVVRDSGIGAGIDSYYEYVAKAYILLGDDKYLNRWETHYAAIMKYMGRGHLMQDVHMHRPTSTSKNFVDALGAFWPGLQVLMGDLKPAIETHEVLYQILQKHDFIPEAVTTDFQVHWGQHLLRPEFVESTYFLFRATRDPHYLEVGKNILKGIQKRARVTCGYASIKDVRTMEKEDRMDSFVLAETFKYLYLLFADESDLIINVEDFVFTTEAHLLPLTLARLSNRTALPLTEKQLMDEVRDEDVEMSRSCPSVSFLFPDGTENHGKKLRDNLAGIVSLKCPTSNSLFRTIRRRLLATEFQVNNPLHIGLLKEMGIVMMTMEDGRLNLIQSFNNAKSQEDAEEGLLFMQEMIEHSKKNAGTTADEDPPVKDSPKAVVFNHLGTKRLLFARGAGFGKQLEDEMMVTGQVAISDPYPACKAANNANEFWGKIVVIERGDCMFVEKARMIESKGAKAGIIVDNIKGSHASGSGLFFMSGDGVDDVSIPMVFLFHKDAEQLLDALSVNPHLLVTLQSIPEGQADGSKNSSFDKKGQPETLEMISTLVNEEEHDGDFFKRSLKKLKEMISPIISIEIKEDDPTAPESSLGEASVASSAKGPAEDQSHDLQGPPVLADPTLTAVTDLINDWAVKKPGILMDVLRIDPEDLAQLLQAFFGSKLRDLDAKLKGLPEGGPISSEVPFAWLLDMVELAGRDKVKGVAGELAPEHPIKEETRLLATELISLVTERVEEAVSDLVLEDMVSSMKNWKAEGNSLKENFEDFISDEGRRKALEDALTRPRKTKDDKSSV